MKVRIDGMLMRCALRNPRLLAALRLIAECRFILLLQVSTYLLVLGQQNVSDAHTCGRLRNLTECSVPPAFCVAVAECLHRLKPSNPLVLRPAEMPTTLLVSWWAVSFGFNVIFFVVCAVKAMKAAVPLTDVRLCFQLNRLYMTKWMRQIRILNYFSLFSVISSAIVSAIIRSTFVSLLTSELMAWVAAIIAVFRLFAPAEQLAMGDISIGVLEKALRAEGQLAFVLADLNATAPSMLLGKLTTAAVAEEVDEMKQAHAASLHPESQKACQSL